MYYLCSVIRNQKKFNNLKKQNDYERDYFERYAFAIRA